MNAIPPKVRAALAADPFMLRCIYTLPGAPATPCSGRIEWEHAFLYRNAQIQERWAIVPCCFNHHRGPHLDKNFNRYVAILRATPAELEAYPRTDWRQLRSWLSTRYPHLLIKFVV